MVQWTTACPDWEKRLIDRASIIPPPIFVDQAEHALAIFKELTLDLPRPRFTVGIFDDVTGLSLPLTDEKIEQRATLEALFYGLGSDGSVSATKNNIKIIGNSTSLYAQGYFVYE